MRHYYYFTMNKLTFFSFLIISSLFSELKAQVIITNDTILPDSSAYFEINNSERGWLIPRMTTQQRDDIQNPAAGLMIYNLDSQSIEFFNDSTWVNVNASAYKNATCGRFTVTQDGITYGTVSYNNRCWLDRNLGALKIADSVDDPLSYGYYYQWGRGTDGHQLATSNTTTTLASNPVPGHGNYIITSSSPYDWLTPPNQGLWNESSGYFNNPCPPGWKVPNLSEWSLVWENWATVNDAYNSPLKISGTGWRNYSNSSFFSVGNTASFWTNQPCTTGSFALGAGTNKFLTLNNTRAQGMPVRCIRLDAVRTPLSRLYGMPQSDGGRSVACCADGDLVILGYTQNYETYGNNYLLLKVNPDGSLDWGKTYGFAYDDYGLAVFPSSDGGYILNGVADWGATYNDQMYVIKTDQAGNQEWDLSIGSTGDENGYDVIQDSDDSYVFFGSTNSYGAGGFDFYLAKADQEGNALYGYSFGTVYDDYGRALIKDTDGGYAMIGYQCCSGGLGGKDVKFLKIHPDFSIGLQYLFGGSSSDEGWDLVLSHDSGYVFAGYTDSYGAGQSDFYVRKISSAGNSVWAYTFGGTATDIARSIIRTADNGFAVLGYTASFGDGQNDMWLLKINVNGIFEWSWVYGITGGELGYSLTQAENGHFYATGFANITLGAGQTEVILVEFNEDGSACIGFYADLAEDRNLFADEFHSQNLPKEKVVVTKVTGDSKKVKTKIFKLGQDQIQFDKAASANITPTVTTICE
jgi:uncharacterized protein (TIGR02145 family)